MENVFVFPTAAGIGFSSAVFIDSLPNPKLEFSRSSILTQGQLQNVELAPPTVLPYGLYGPLSDCVNSLLLRHACVRILRGRHGIRRQS